MTCKEFLQAIKRFAWITTEGAATFFVVWVVFHGSSTAKDYVGATLLVLMFGFRAVVRAIEGSKLTIHNHYAPGIMSTMRGEDSR